MDQGTDKGLLIQRELYFKLIEYYTMQKHIAKSLLLLYKFIRPLHETSTSKIWEVQQIQSKRRFALKKEMNVLATAQSAQHAYRQIAVLRQINHINIIHIHHVFCIRNDLYLLYTLMPITLYTAILSNQLQQDHHTYFTYQLLLALTHLHSRALIHRQLKTTNILLDSHCNLIVSGFKMVRTLTAMEQADAILSEQISSKWSCAPQVLMGSRSYGRAADMWSLGCIVAQMILKRPLFNGQSTLQQLQLILSFTGIPSPQDIKSIDSPIAHSLITQIKCKPIPTHQYFPTHCILHDLIKGLLAFNPQKRLTAEQALSLPLFDKYRALQEKSKQEVTLMLDDERRFDIQTYKEAIITMAHPIITQPTVTYPVKARRLRIVKSHKSVSVILGKRKPTNIKQYSTSVSFCVRKKSTNKGDNKENRLKRSDKCTYKGIGDSKQIGVKKVGMRKSSKLVLGVNRSSKLVLGVSKKER